MQFQKFFVPVFFFQIVKSQHSEAENIVPPTPVELGVTVEDTLRNGEIKYYVFKMPASGIKVVFKTNTAGGSIKVYYSYITENPSEDINYFAYIK